MKWGLMVLMLAVKSVAGQFYFYNDEYLDQPLLVEAGLTTGIMNCLTDLGTGNKRSKGFDIQWQNFRPDLGIQFGIKWNQQVGVRLQINYGSVTAADSVLKSKPGDAIYRYQRNLHFRSRVFDALLSGVIYPAGFFRTERPPKLAPYFFGGVGIFHFKPEAFLLESWTSLSPLRSEGNDPATFYNQWQLNFPLGGGVNYELNARLSIQIELNYRVLRTDYLDDVSTKFIDPVLDPRPPEQAAKLKALYALSQVRDGPVVSQPGAIRGNPGNRDSYFSLQAAVSWVLNRHRIR